jgi:hypothetical protein
VPKIRRFLLNLHPAALRQTEGILTMTDHAQLTAREISGPLKQILTNLSGNDGRFWFGVYNRVHRKENPWLTEKGPAKAVPDLLGSPELLCTAPATKRFVLNEHFGNKKAEVKTYLYNFGRNLLDLVEEDVPETPLNARRLQDNSVDTPIRDALGEKQETKFCQIWHTIISGSLRKDCRYIFYARDKDGVPWAVYMSWDGDGWFVYACSVGRPDAWLAGNLVASR